MILNDLSSTVTTAVRGFYQDKANKYEPLDHKHIRAIALSSILGTKRKFAKYGQMVLCLDSKPYWREYVFPFYKKNRKKIKAKDDFDWKLYYDILGDIILEFQKNLPFVVVGIRGAEGDDIVAVLARTYIQQEPIVITSADKDLIQCQLKYSKKIKQYSSKTKKFITTEDYDLLTHIIKGDTTDGIPNILSDDDVFLVDSKRQKSVYQKFIDSVSESEDNIPQESLDKYKRNQKLIDVDNIPVKLSDMIVNEYQNAIGNVNNKVYSYLIKNRMKPFLDRMNEF